MIKSINWAPVLSFLVPGLGQIGLSKYEAGLLWFLIYAVLLYVGIFVSSFFFIMAFGLWVLNIFDAAGCSYKS